MNKKLTRAIALLLVIATCLSFVAVGIATTIDYSDSTDDDVIVIEGVSEEDEE